MPQGVGVQVPPLASIVFSPALASSAAKNSLSSGDSRCAEFPFLERLGAGIAANAGSDSRSRAKTPLDAVFQVHYAANLAIGDSVINYTNGGSAITASSNGNICANIYAFNPDHTMAACCACVITPDELIFQSVRNDIIDNTLTPAVPQAAVIKLLASQPKNSTTCNASSPTASTLAPGLVAWGTNLHPNTSTTPVSYSVTEQEFSYPALSATELNNLTSQCGGIQTNGAGAGLCSCGALGGR